jgi:hypothetical protein
MRGAEENQSNLPSPRLSSVGRSPCPGRREAARQHKDSIVVARVSRSQSAVAAASSYLAPPPVPSLAFSPVRRSLFRFAFAGAQPRAGGRPRTRGLERTRAQQVRARGRFRRHVRCRMRGVRGGPMSHHADDRPRLGEATGPDDAVRPSQGRGFRISSPQCTTGQRQQTLRREAPKNIGTPRVPASASNMRFATSRQGPGCPVERCCY